MTTPPPRPEPVTRVMGAKPSKTYGDGERRVCVDDDCETILSRYNPGPGCARHQNHNRKFRVRGARRD